MPILEALIFMHQKGMVHCDVEPANVLLTESGNPRLADFGGSSRLEDCTGTLPRYIGTPGFLPPEVGMKRRFDVTADSWCLGITI